VQRDANSYSGTAPGSYSGTQTGSSSSGGGGYEATTGHADDRRGSGRRLWGARLEDDSSSIGTAIGELVDGLSPARRRRLALLKVMN